MDGSLNIGDVIVMKFDTFTTPPGNALQDHMWVVYKVQNDKLFCNPVTSQMSKKNKFPKDLYVIKDWKLANFRKPSLIKLNCYCEISLKDVYKRTGRLTKEDISDFLYYSTKCHVHELIESFDDQFTWEWI